MVIYISQCFAVYCGSFYLPEIKKTTHSTIQFNFYLTYLSTPRENQLQLHGNRWSIGMITVHPRMFWIYHTCACDVVSLLVYCCFLFFNLSKLYLIIGKHANLLKCITFIVVSNVTLIFIFPPKSWTIIFLISLELAKTIHTFWVPPIILTPPPQFH